MLRVISAVIELMENLMGKEAKNFIILKHTQKKNMSDS